MVDVVAIGNIVNDFSVGPIDVLPKAGQLFSVDRMKPVLGGNPANMASGLGKMGVKVRPIGKIGKDMFGDFVLERLRACNVDISRITRIDGVQTPTTLGFVNSSGDRGFLHCFGTNAEMVEEDYDLSEYGKGTIFYVGGIEILPRMRGIPVSHVIKKARDRGMITVLDTAYDPLDEWLPVIEPSLPFLDILFVGEAEAKIYADSEDPKGIISFFRKYGIERIVLKRGEKGCFVYEDNRMYSIAALPVDAKDTIGAGDNFLAGYLSGMVKKYPWEKCACLATAAGSLSTQYFGGEAQYDGFEEVLKWAETLSVSEES